jgi:MFS family permease
VSAGGAVMGLGTVAMAVAPGQGLLFAGRFLVGAGAAVLFVGALTVAARWFPPSHFGTLSALTATMGILGSLIGTAPFAGLVALVGWRGALALIGLVTLAAAGLCAAVVRDHPPGPAGSRAPALGLRHVLAGLGRVLRNRDTWPPFFAFFFLLASTQNLLLWVVPYLRDVYGLSLTDAALYATATSLALLVSGPLTGFVSDRVLRRRRLPYAVLTAALFGCWTVFLATLGRLPLPGTYALLFAMGLAGGAFVLTWPLGRELNPPELAGVAVATVNLGGFLGVALSQGPLGAVLDARWTGGLVGAARVYPVGAYRAVFAACAAFVLLSALTAWLIRETGGRNVYHERHGPAARPTRGGIMKAP